jgi:polyisoprenyl-teichoic acid--peptidoglycan teichoic acid transferase
MRAPGLLRAPAVAAALSFLLPGLGTAAAGKRRRGLVVAIPALVILGFGLFFILFNRRAIIDSLFSPSTLFTFIVFDVAILLYRLWAIADAWVVAGRSGSAPRLGKVATGFVMAAILVATLGTHLTFAALDVADSNLLASAFNPNGPSWFGDPNLAPNETAPAVSDDPGATDASATDAATAPPSASPSASASVSTAASEPVVTPGATTDAGIPIFPVDTNVAANTPPARWRDDGYLNVLLVGADSGVGRWSLRTDTMILLEVDIASGRAAMYGIPRNLENVPLGPEAADAYACHCFPYPNLLNALWRDAVNKPKSYPYPGTDFVRGFKALEGAIGAYLGLHVDGVVLVNLMGFVNLVDALGGLTINVPTELKDSQYSRPQDGKDIAIDIKPGLQHMDGLTALAYARSRHQDSDYGRMGRQQAVLRALREQLNPCELLPRVPSIIGALGDTFWTDMPIEDAPTLVALASKVTTGNVDSIALTPAVTGNPVGFLTVPRWQTVKSIVAHGLDKVPAGISGGSSSGAGLSC